jgi:Tol biopolymer transport system component
VCHPARDENVRGLAAQRLPARAWMTRRARLVVAASLAILVSGLVTSVGLSRVADELPKPVADLAQIPARVWTRLFPPRVKRTARLAGLTQPERDAVDVLSRHVDGLVVWSSNRSGNHELYLLDLPARSVRQLTRHPNVDFFSRFSPDGRRVLFLRSQREGVSARDKSAWDLMVVRVDGTGEELLARGAYHPTWMADGAGILFERGMQFVRYDLASRREHVLLDGATAFPGVGEMGDGELSPSGRRLAFGLRGTFSGAFGLSGGFSGAVALDLDARALAILTREQACQTTWTPDGHGVLWIETGGHGGTRVMTGTADGADRRVLMDLPGARSHEYFPKLSNDGRWLVWAASAEGHEHDRADYDIFLWSVGTPWQRAIQLTQHPGNDQWPDLWIRPGR